MNAGPDRPLSSPIFIEAPHGWNHAGPHRFDAAETSVVTEA
jgi:hypothetical protein